MNNASSASGNRASFSTDIHDELTPHGTELLSWEERHRYDMWPRLTEPAGANKFDLKVRPLTRQEIEFGFATMTTLATKLARNKQLKSNRQREDSNGSRIPGARSWCCGSTDLTTADM